MKRASFLRRLLGLLALTLLASAFSFAQTGEQTLKMAQTEGFAGGKEILFTYFMNFMCVDQPGMDLNNNGKQAGVDPAEFQTPICAVGHPSTIDPTGAPSKNTDKLWVLVPFFPGTEKDAFTPTLTTALNSLFGFVPQAFVNHPDVAVQCPEPGAPEGSHAGMPGTCTMHASTVDLGPVLAALGKVPPHTSVLVPTPNHSHLLETSQANVAAEWWQVIVVLVTDPKAWPNEEGTSGITSVSALRAAQSKGQALGDVSTNFFLYFKSQSMAGM